MSPLDMLWIASAIGALLFFASGFLSAQGSRQPAAAVRGPTQGELELLTLYADESARRAQLEHQLEYSEGSLLRAQQALQQAQAERARLAEELRGREQSRERIATLERENASLLARATTANVQVGPALSSKLARLQGEHHKLTAELEKYATQNAILVTERDALKFELDRLPKLAEAQRTAASRAPAPRTPSGSRPASAPRPSQSGTKRRVREPESTLEGNLLRHLAMIVREPGVTVVLSDNHGFPLVGVGPEHTQEGVSVLTSLAHELATRAREFIGFERIELMEMADADGRALRVRFFDWEDQPLAVGSLVERRLASLEDEENLVASFPELLLEARTA